MVLTQKLSGAVTQDRKLLELISLELISLSLFKEFNVYKLETAYSVKLFN